MATTVEGHRLDLRVVTVDDAEYVHKLRVDPAYNAHLSAVTGTVADQALWIERYKEREAAGEEFYYIIVLKDGTPCGTVRLYDITPESFTWGSWVLDHNKPAKAALESAVLVYRLGYDVLGLPKAVFEVDAANTHTQAFHRRFGAHQTGQDESNLYFDLTNAQFEEARRGFEAIIRGAE